MIKSLRYSLFFLLVLTAMTGYSQAPTITSFSPATGPVGTLVTINGTNLGTPTAFTIGGQNAIVVSNTGSVLVGMVMPGAATGAVSITTAGGTAGGGGNFTLTATKYPSLQQGDKLVGTGNTGASLQGQSVAMSADGNTAIVGATGDNGDTGAAWVYTRSGGIWTQQGTKLVGTGNMGASSQGTSVSLSADGNTAIVGGYSDNSSIGAAWVYTRNGGLWTQQGTKLVGTGNVGGSSQGTSVSLSADGNTAIVGGYSDNSSTGAVWVYVRSGAAWTQQGSKLVGTGNMGEFSDQGSAVSLSADGNTAIVGGSQDNSTVGAAWVYTRSGGVWTQQGAKLVGTGSRAGTAQGISVSLSADGNTAIVGGPEDAGDVGAAWVWIRSGGIWTQQGAKLVGGGLVGSGQFGWSVSLSADGNTAMASAYLSSAKQGAVWVYTRNGNTWTQQGTQLVGTGNTGAAEQGYWLSLSADGNTAIVGGPKDNSSLGAAWVYTMQPAPTVQASAVSFTNTGSTTTTASWTNGNGTSRTVFIAKTSTGNPPVVTTAYIANPSFGSGTQIGNSGWFCVYNGSGSTVNITGLAAATTYRVMSVEYNGTTNFPQYLTSVSTGNPNNVTTLSNIASLSNIKLTPSSTLTNTGTSGNTTTYTTTANSATASVTVTPTTQDPTATVTVNGVTVASGTASGPVALALGQTTITTAVTAQDGTIKIYSIVVTRLSNNALLSTIKLTPASTLTNTGTTGTTTTYTTNTNSATTSVTVTPTTQDARATIKVNGNVVASGTASAPIAIAVGQSAITTVVTAQDGTTRTYSITVTRLSNNALLSSIKLTPASTLTNTGTTGTTTSYTTSVSNATTSVTVTPTTQDANAKIKVNGVAVTSETASGSIALAIGPNTITIVVTAQDGTTNHTYSITITRAKSNNALLSTIKLTPASTLTNTGTAGATTTYTTSVSNATTSVTVTATTQDATATVKVNGTAVTSGTPSGSITLFVGQNTINTVVTAQDGTTFRYTITVDRATGPLMSLYQAISVIQLADSPPIENDGILVHQGVSPNGDGLNDYLLIDGLAAYPDNKITIINSSGTIIFEAKGYNNISKVFDGHSGINGRMQQPGTYYYSLDYVADGHNKHKTGYIILKY